jgi:hypothetical protein
MNPHLEAYRCTAQTADDADWGRGERFGVAKPVLEEIQTATVWVAVETTLPLTGCTLLRGRESGKRRVRTAWPMLEECQISLDADDCM